MSIIVANPVPISLEDIDDMAQAARGKISRLYLHWTAGHYHHVYDAYHLSITGDGKIYSPADGDIPEAFLIHRSHTYQRNTGAIGIALCCSYKASFNACGEIDPGPEPPTSLQIETLARVVAHIIHYLGLDLNSTVVQTHYEVAKQDGYGPGSLDPDMRWDLWFLDGKPYRKGLYPGGEVLRGKASYYLENDFGQRGEVQQEWQLTRPCLNAA